MERKIKIRRNGEITKRRELLLEKLKTEAIQFLNDNTEYFFKNVKIIGSDQKIVFADSQRYLYCLSFQQLKTAIKKGAGFSKFHSRNIYSIKNIKNWLKIENKKFSLTSTKFINAIEKMSWKCNICEKHWDCSWNEIYSQKSNCPHCYKSKGEGRIERFLIKNNISYVREYKFDDCKDKRKLKFDFAIFKNENIILLIEYDGVLHFYPYGYREEKDSLENRKRRDGIKNEYCKNNNIPLVRIPYWKYEKIEKILEKELKNVQRRIY